MVGVVSSCIMFFFFSSRRRHTRLQGDWSSDVCSSDLPSDEESATGAAHLSSFGKAHADAYLSLCPGLPSAGSHREALPGSRCAHLLVDLARTTEHAPGSHSGVAHQRR